MVAGMAVHLERKSNFRQRIGAGLWRRRLGFGIWRIRALAETEESADGSDPWTLDRKRSGGIDQHKGIMGSRTSAEGRYEMEEIKKRNYSLSDRFHGRFLLSQQDDRQSRSLGQGGDKGTETYGGQRNKLDRGTHFLQGEPHRRQALSFPDESKRLATQPRGLSEDQEKMGPVFDRLVRQSSQYTSATILFSRTGRGGGIRRRASKFMAEREGLRQPPLLDHWTDTTKTAERRTKYGYHSTDVAHTGMVAGSVEHADRLSNVTSGARGLVRPSTRVEVKRQGKRSSVEDHRMQDLREALKSEGFSKETIEIALAAISAKTRRNYSYCWGRWMAFAKNKGVSGFNPPLPLYLDFVAQEYKEKGTGSSVNHAMTVVGGTLKLLGRNLNEEGMAVAFRQSAMKNTPPTPKYEDTWDITLVFEWARKLGKNESMSLENLREKVILLLRLDTFARASDIAKLYRSEVKFAKEDVSVRFYRPKEWRPRGKSSIGEFSPWITIRKVDTAVICTYRALQIWLERTTKLAAKGVICRLGKKGGDVAAETIARISQGVMEKIGIPSKFRSQSVRGAASSAAFDFGAPLAMVLSQGRWSNASMWKKHYYRRLQRKTHRKTQFDHVSGYLRMGISLNAF
jgi:hypothetical protein